MPPAASAAGRPISAPLNGADSAELTVPGCSATSKAALNMLVKTASIEVARTHPQAVLVALHPGTVNSALSAPFNGAEIGRPAADAAGDMLGVLDGLGVEATGSFYAYSGENLPW